MRYDSRNNVDIDLQGEDCTQEEAHKAEKVTMQQAVHKNRHREVFNPVEETQNFSGIRPTEVKNC